MYLAKSYPVEESLEEHTDNLIKQFKILKNLYEGELRINWDLLQLACLYHDMGKVNRVFQKKVRGEKIDRKFSDIPHSYLSILFINYRNLIEKYDFSIDDLIILINVVAYHHKRAPLNQEMEENIRDYYPYLIEDLENFSYYRLPSLKDDLNMISLEIVSKTGTSGIDLDLLERYILMKGLLNKIDYGASGYYRVEYPNDFLVDSMENVKLGWGKDAAFNSLQEYMIENRDENIVAIAETGYGKTEAGLLWIGNNKGFFTLPLKSAINQIYERLVGEIVLESVDRRVGLLHSDTLSEYVKKNENLLDQDIVDYQEATKELSMPLTVCTLDQIFDFVYKYVGFERKLATLSYSKIVIDEIQMYSSDLVAYIIIGLRQLTRLGGQFAIVTATFPPFIGDLLAKNQLDYMKPRPFLYNDRIRHSLKLERAEINSDYIYSKYKNNKVLVIVNTVKKLNELYDQLQEKYGLEAELDVFHSGFTREDRKIKEENIVEFGQKSNTDSGIWICTQVAEASLDIDFDLLITELSDLNGLFQRMGRCYRNRELDKDYNIFVFDGGDKLCSGIGYVNDRDIYKKSKEQLRLRGDGSIDENEKIELINKIYSTDSLKDTKYYKDIIGTIEYIDSINYDEFRKKDVIKYFRNINSIDVIPRPVYENNKEDIEEIIQILSNRDEFQGNQDDLYLRKKKARLDLDKYKLSIAYYLVGERKLEIREINKYESINIYSCQYSSDYGIKHLEEEENLLDMFF